MISGMSTSGVHGIGMTSQRTRDRLAQRLRDHGISDETVSAAEASVLPVTVPVNSTGLPASQEARPAPNASIRIPTRVDQAVGQFRILRAASGAPLSSDDNGPVDSGVVTREIVRAFRAGNYADGNNGFLCEPDDLESLSGKLTEILAHRAELGRIGENGKKTADETFSWETIAARTAALYQAQIT